MGRAGTAQFRAGSSRRANAAAGSRIASERASIHDEPSSGADLRSATKHEVLIPSRRAEATELEQSVLTLVESFGYSSHACFAVRLALEEALNNAITHGNAEDTSKSVRVRYAVDERAVRISVCDEGPGFEPESVPDPRRGENLERPGGRGVLLIHAYMTRVRYNRRGNCVTMIKRRGCPRPQTGGEAGRGSVRDAGESA